MNVLHSVEKWLPLTQSWVHEQIQNIPQEFTNFVVADDVTDAGHKIPRLSAFATLPVLLRAWYRVRYRSNRLGAYRQKVAQRAAAAIVHSHFGHIAWRDISVCRSVGACHVTTFYGFDVNFLPRQKLWYERYQELFGCVDAVLCEGPHMAHCIQRLGCPPEKVRVHHLGVSLGRIPFVKRQFGGGSPVRILIASSFVEKKGIPYALHAIALVRKQVPVIVTIIGDTNGSRDSIVEKQRILDAVERFSLTDCTTFLGYQQYDRLLQQAYHNHIYIAPSVTASTGDTEGGAPVSLIEMAASGMPVVSTTHCDIPNVVEDGVSAWLAGERDVEGLAAKLEMVIANPDDRDRRVENARRRIEREFDSAVQGLKLADLYRELVASKRPYAS